MTWFGQWSPGSPPGATMSFARRPPRPRAPGQCRRQSVRFHVPPPRWRTPRALMTDAKTATTCASCGAPGTGRFCSTCGAPRDGGQCRHCGSPLAPSARFCPACGQGVGTASSAARAGDRTPWIIAGAALVGLMGVLLVTLTRSPATMVGESTEVGGTAAAAPPDISNMSPRERFDRLYNRVMQAAQSGDEATVSRVTPMALMAYAQLDSLDAD